MFQLEAVDEDTGLNGKIRYSILSIANNNRDGSKTFEVNDLTGLITTKGDINAEVLDRYEVGLTVLSYQKLAFSANFNYNMEKPWYFRMYSLHMCSNKMYVRVPSVYDKADVAKKPYN